MRRPHYLLSALLAGSVLAGGSAAAAATTATHKTEKPTVTEFKSAKYGMILENAAGRTLYGLTSDKANKSVCTGICTTYWPPLSPKGKLVAGKGLHKSWLKSFVRSGKTHQVEYHGIPLYRYSGDSGHGQVHGFGIASNGGKWYPVSPKGSLVKKKVSGGGGGGGW